MYIAHNSKKNGSKAHPMKCGCLRYTVERMEGPIQGQGEKLIAIGLWLQWHIAAAGLS